MPLRARLTAIFGALVLAPDTMLLRLSAFESSSEWLGSWGIVFYRAWGRLVFIPLMYVLANGGRSTAYLDAVRALGAKRLWRGAALYMVQNVAFIVAASMTYIASVLSIVATGPLCSALFSRLLLEEKVPTHTWLASLACVGWVLLIFADALDSGGETRHVVGTSVALLVPVGTGAYWTFCKANPDADMVPALSTSGLLGQALALAVVFAADARSEDGGYGRVAPLVPVTDDGGVAVTALVFQCVLVAAAFMFLTIGAKDVPSAEVSLYLLMELPLATLLVWWATEETPPWQVFVGAAGLLCTMGVESWIGITESRRESAAEIDAAEVDAAKVDAA